MENDPAHAKRLEDNLNRRNEFANPETTVAVPSEGRTDATKRARQDELELPPESANTGGASSSSAGVDVDMRVIHAGKRPLDPGGDKDMVCGLDVCDELDELDEADVDMRVIHAGKRPLDPGGHRDMVCGLDVCDELDKA